MSLRILVLDRLRDVALKLEAREGYAVLWEEGRFNWDDPVHVLRNETAEVSPQGTLNTFKELAQKAWPSGTSIEMSPSPPTHGLLIPVPIKGKRVALGFLIVQGGSRTAYFMLELARLQLQRDDYFSEGGPPPNA